MEEKTLCNKKVCYTCWKFTEVEGIPQEQGGLCAQRMSDYPDAPHQTYRTHLTDTCTDWAVGYKYSEKESLLDGVYEIDTNRCDNCLHSSYEFAQQEFGYKSCLVCMKHYGVEVKTTNVCSMHVKKTNVCAMHEVKN